MPADDTSYEADALPTKPTQLFFNVLVTESD